MSNRPLRAARAGWLHRSVVGRSDGGRWNHRYPRGGLDPIDAARHRHPSGLHPGAGAHGPDRCGVRRRHPGGSWRDRVVLECDRRTLEWHPVRGTVQAHPRHRSLSQGGAQEKVTETYDTFEVKGSGSALCPSNRSRPCCCAPRRHAPMAGRESDGAIINWLSADNAATVSRSSERRTPTRRSPPASLLHRHRMPRRLAAWASSQPRPTSMCRSTAPP